MRVLVGVRFAAWWGRGPASNSAKLPTGGSRGSACRCRVPRVVRQLCRPSKTAISVAVGGRYHLRFARRRYAAQCRGKVNFPDSVDVRARVLKSEQFSPPCHHRGTSSAGTPAAPRTARRRPPCGAAVCRARRWSCGWRSGSAMPRATSRARRENCQQGLGGLAGADGADVAVAHDRRLEERFRDRRRQRRLVILVVFERGARIGRAARVIIHRHRGVSVSWNGEGQNPGATGAAVRVVAGRPGHAGTRWTAARAGPWRLGAWLWARRGRSRTSGGARAARSALRWR